MRWVVMTCMALSACGRLGFGTLDGSTAGDLDSGVVDGPEVVMLTFTHNAGYAWDTASVTEDLEVMTFQWQSTAYSTGGHGAIYGSWVLDDFTTLVTASQITLILDTELASVTASDCASVTSDGLTRISDGQVACVKRIPQGDYAAVMLMSHTEDEGADHALTAALAIKRL